MRNGSSADLCDTTRAKQFGSVAEDGGDDVEPNVLGCRVDILGTNREHGVRMAQCCFTSTETIRLIRTGSPGRPRRLSHSS